MMRLSQRIAKLETIRIVNRVRYVISNCPPSDAERDAGKNGADIECDEAECQSPTITEAEWHDAFCRESESR